VRTEELVRKCWKIEGNKRFPSRLLNKTSEICWRPGLRKVFERDLPHLACKTPTQEYPNEPLNTLSPSPSLKLGHYIASVSLYSPSLIPCQSPLLPHVSAPIIRDPEITILHRRPHPQEQSPGFGITKPGIKPKKFNRTSLKEQPDSEMFPIR
jgi:hypothetical protein